MQLNANVHTALKMPRLETLSRQERRRTHIAKCPYCGRRHAWLAQGIWTCHACAHSWARR